MHASRCHTVAGSHQPAAGDAAGACAAAAWLHQPAAAAGHTRGESKQLRTAAAAAAIFLFSSGATLTQPRCQSPEQRATDRLSASQRLTQCLLNLTYWRGQLRGLAAMLQPTTVAVAWTCTSLTMCSASAAAAAAAAAPTAMDAAPRLASVEPGVPLPQCAASGAGCRCCCTLPAHLLG
jgi:hypothetical protein